MCIFWIIGSIFTLPSKIYSNYFPIECYLFEYLQHSILSTLYVFFQFFHYGERYIKILTICEPIQFLLNLYSSTVLNTFAMLYNYQHHPCPALSLSCNTESLHH